LAVLTDHPYSIVDGVVYGDRAYVRFLTELRPHVERLVLVGRLDPQPRATRYAVPAGVIFAGLPHYESLLRPLEVARALGRALRRFDLILDEVDTVWLHGPHHLGLACAAMARARGRAVVLAVRQDLPTYVRSRRPGNRPVALAADVLELAWRTLARTTPVVTVGPQLTDRYRHARRLHELSVSMVSAADIVPPSAERDFGGATLTALSVGRLDAEKNPLLLANVIARLRERDPRWRLVVVGEGPLEPDLRARVRDLGVEEHVDMRGYVPLTGGLMELYRTSDAFLHVSWTEGLPQVLFEAFAARLPVVATAVGGVPQAADGAAVLIPPGDAGAAVDALEQVAANAGLRARIVAAGVDRVAGRTIEAECARLAAFLAEAGSARRSA
jgi:glycosyltransferase involved in cell wall biosynthesis